MGLGGPPPDAGGVSIRTDASKQVEHATVRVLAEADSLEEAAPEILHGICSALGWDFGALWLLDRSGTELQCIETWCVNESRLGRFAAACTTTHMARGVGLPGHIWEEMKPVWIEDVVAEP